MKRLFLAAVVSASVASATSAQTIPEGSQAAKVQPAYRRTPSYRIDPFRHVSIPHWGFVFSLGATASNNTLNLSDVFAIKFLADQDSLLPSMLDILGLIPRGSGLKLAAQGEGGFYLGGPFGSHLSLGFQARGTGYGSIHLEDGPIAILRDGNATTSDFPLGSSNGTGLGTLEGGAHAVVRVGPMGSPDGVKLSFGFGARYLRPAAFARVRLLPVGGMIHVAPDSIGANITVTREITKDPRQTIKGQNSWATDLLFRLEWPTSGLALEAMVANIGSIDVANVEYATASLNINTTSVTGAKDQVDSLDFVVQDSNATVSLTLPRVVRFGASAWANRILQIDLSTTMPVTGDFATPLAVDIGTTWRFIRTLPLRAAMSIGGAEGFGFSGGLAIEARTMFLQIGAQSLGGFLKNAKGAGLRVELGLFF